MERDELIDALAKNVSDCGFPASALRSVLVDLLKKVRLPDDEKLYILEGVAQSIREL